RGLTAEITTCLGIEEGQLFFLRQSRHHSAGWPVERAIVIHGERECFPGTTIEGDILSALGVSASIRHWPHRHVGLATRLEFNLDNVAIVNVSVALHAATAGNG